MPDREALADYALEFVRVDALLLRDPPPTFTNLEQQRRYRDTLYRQKAELLAKLHEAAQAEDPSD